MSLKACAEQSITMLHILLTLLILPGKLNLKLEDVSDINTEA